MSFNLFIPFVGALLCIASGLFALLKDRRSFVHRTFAFGMIALALEQAFIAGGIQYALFSESIPWQRLQILAAAFVPGTWLLFSLSFGRANYWEFVKKWRWAIIATFAIPLILVIFPLDFFYAGGIAQNKQIATISRLGWTGYLFYFFLLLSAVLILMNLERTVSTWAGITFGFFCMIF